MSSSSRQIRSLITHARQAQRRAYAPYSHFRVGAALLASNGKIYHGCNVENSSYGLTICAERTALYTAIAEGARKFQALAIVSDEGGFTPPCGACRQVLMDLAGEVEIILADRRGHTQRMTMHDLLPYPFTAADLRRKRKR
jgi:cytidine deaminase